MFYNRIFSKRYAIAGIVFFCGVNESNLTVQNASHLEYTTLVTVYTI